MSNTVREETSQLQKKGSQFLKETADDVNEGSHRVEDMITSAKDAGKSALRSIKEEMPKLRETWDTAEETVTDGFKKGAELIRKHPVEALLIGAAAGFAIGSLVKTLRKVSK